MTLQTRPEKFLGRIELWDAAEAALKRCLERAGFAVNVLPAEGAFYGPKIGFDFSDVSGALDGRSTVQIDCAMPERFGLRYVTAEGTEATPVMMHRAVLGSIERFIAILLEHCAGAFPLWLAPVQFKILTVTDDQKEYARKVFDQLRARADGESSWTAATKSSVTRFARRNSPRFLTRRDRRQRSRGRHGSAAAPRRGKSAAAAARRIYRAAAR